jgi:hypothetical protein
MKMAFLGLPHHHDGIEQPDARQPFADRFLRKLFDVKAVRLPAKHNSFGQHLDPEVSNTAIGRLMDDVFQLDPLHSLSPFLHLMLHLPHRSPTKRAVRADFAGKSGAINGHDASRVGGCKVDAKW